MGSMPNLIRRNMIYVIFIPVRLRICLVLTLLIYAVSLKVVAQECGSEVLLRHDVAIEKTRPRLYVSDAKLNKLKNMTRIKPYSDYWASVYKKTSHFLKPNIKYLLNRKLDESSIRFIGDRLPYLALSYLISEEQRFLLESKRLSFELIRLNNWASNKDIGAAHILFGLSIMYDWLYKHLSLKERQTIKEALIKHANILSFELKNAKIWWAKQHSLLQNHNHVNAMSIAVAGIALLGEYEGADEWIELAEKNFDQVMRLLPEDGAHHEGVSYWSYSMDALLKYYLAVGVYDNYSKLRMIKYIQNAYRFRLHASLPGFEEHANYSDSLTKDYKGPGYLLRAIASIYCQPRAQWLANTIEKARTNRNYSWQDLIWHDKTVISAEQNNMKDHAFFPEIGLFIKRTSWDRNAIWFMYKGGPLQGKKALEKRIYAGGHVHPDGGHISLWKEGRWILSDDGYVFKKRTSNHNTLIINNNGQVGEGKKWFDKYAQEKVGTRAEIIEYIEGEGYEFIESELAGLYPIGTKLQSFKRGAFITSRGLILVVDKIRLGERKIVQRLFHSQEKIHKLDNGMYCTGGYYIKTFTMTPSPVRTEIKPYSISESERNKSHGIYKDGCLRREGIFRVMTMVYFIYSNKGRV